jgi:hypothetical protein
MVIFFLSSNIAFRLIEPEQQLAAYEDGLDDIQAEGVARAVEVDDDAADALVHLGEN